jgi:iron complex outermembrane receptor protein
VGYQGKFAARGRRTGLVIVALGVLAVFGGATGASATPRRVFDVPPQPLAQALLDFAVQANISIGVGETGACRRASHGASGLFTVNEALDRILADTGCSYQVVDSFSVRVVRQPHEMPASVRSAARPAPRRIEAPPMRPILPEVVVTATRRSALAMRLPDAISVISGSRMALSGDASLADLAGRAPGLTVTNLGPGADKTIIRGLSDGGLTGHAQSTVGIYLDGTRLTYSAPDPDLRLTDIDQVEVLQGPQGALYGGGSIAGVIHIATRQPDLNRYGGMVSVTAAGSEGGASSGVIEGVVNVPIVPGRLALRAVAYDEHDGGYVDDVRLAHDNANTTNRSGVRLSVKLNLSGDWSIDLGAVHQDLDAADSQYATPHLGAYSRGVVVPEPHSNSFDEVHLRLAGDIQPGQFKNTLSFVRHDIDTRYDVSNALPLFAAAALVTPSTYDEADRIEAVVDEATLTSAGASRFQWLVGAFLSDARQVVKSRIITQPPDAPPVTPLYAERRVDSIQEFALYGEATFDINSRLALGVGARLGITDIATSSIVSAPDGGGPALFHGRTSDVEWAPKVSLRYQISRSTMVYMLASEGARGGGFNTSGPIGTVFSGPGGVTEPFRRFGGDELWNVEAGIKLRALSDRLDIRATGFYALWNNIQSDQLLPSGLPYTANIGDGRNFGLEFEVAYAVDGLELRLAGVLDEPELTHRTTPFPSMPHSGLPGAPRGSVGAAIHYQPHVSGSVHPFFEASIDYVGQSRLTFDAVTSRRMGDYTRTRLTAGADAGAWRIAAFVDNPLGVTGDTFAYGNPFTLRHTRQVTPQPPRTAGLQLTRSF